MTAVSATDSGGLGDMIADSADRLFLAFGARANIAVRKGLDSRLVDDAAWAEIAQAGFPLAMLDEDAGGVGAEHAFTILRLAAKHAFISPLADTMGANWILAQAGMSPAMGAAAFTETVFDLRRIGADWRVSGVARAVAWARGGALIALGEHNDRRYIIRLDPAKVSAGSSLADEPRDTLVFDMALDATCVSAAPAGLDPFAIRKLGAALRTAQMAGAMSGILEMTVQYARERKQFGRPLGGFQAVQQLLATMATQSAAADVAAALAAEAAEGDFDHLAIASAKIRAGEAAGAVAASGHQLHGAIGFTKEHPLQLLTRRLWAWRDDFGGEAAWSIHLGRALVNTNQPALWPQLTNI
jgi:acyl-CoA dehydrogenase